MVTVKRIKYKDKKTGKMKLTQTYSFRMRVNGKPKTISTGLTQKREAERWALNWITKYKSAGIVPKKHAPLSITDLYDLVKQDYIKNGYTSFETLGYRFKHLGKFFKLYDAHEIDNKLTNKYIKARLKEGGSITTIKVELAALNRALRLAQEDDKIASKPNIKIPNVDKVRKEFFTNDEYEAIVANLKGAYKAFVQIAYVIGCRRSELFHLKFKDLDFKNKLITFRDTKNGTDRRAPMYGDISTILNDARKEAIKKGRCVPDNYVWVTKVNTPFQTLSTPWTKALEKAGCPDKTFHSLRKTACRNLINSGVPESTACKICGWKDRRSMERYDIKSVKDFDLFQDRYEQHLDKLGADIKEDSADLI